MNRRDFLMTVPVAGALVGGSAFLGLSCSGKRPTSSGLHIPGQIVSPYSEGVPEGKRAPFGWPIAKVGPAPILLNWENLRPLSGKAYLRIAVAIDVRDEKLIEVSLPRSGRTIGVFDVRFASVMQLYQLELSLGNLEAVGKEGVSLKLIQGDPLCVFAPGKGVSQEFTPHLYIEKESNAIDSFYDRMASLGSIQPWGWNEGCVLDGLLDLSDNCACSKYSDAAKLHLSMYLKGDTVIYEDPRSRPKEGELYGIEGGLPYAAMARLYPKHPLLDRALDFWFSCRDEEGAVIDGTDTTSEGAYVVGYPLAVLAKLRGDKGLGELALRQVLVRHRRLFDGQQFSRKVRPGGVGKDVNWSRGVAWQLLGAARTLDELKGRADLSEGIEAFRSLALWTMQFQRSDGLWSVFLDDRELLADTAGSAGLAAALAIGARNGWLDSDARIAAERCCEAVLTYLTPDGFLGGVSQSNRGGETLQRANYRVIYQMGMGVLAQLMAALEFKA